MLHRGDCDQASLVELRRAIADERPTTVVLRNYRKDGELFWNQLSIVPVHDDDGVLQHFIGIIKDITAHKNAERELMSWVMRLDALTSLSADGLVTFGGDGLLTFANKAFHTLIGLKSDEVKGIDIAAFDRIFAKQCEPGYAYRTVMDSLPPVGQSVSLDESHQSTDDVVEIRLIKPSKRILVRTVRRVSKGSTLLYFTDVTWQRELEEMKSQFLANAAHELRTPMASILGYAELLLLKNYDEKTRNELLLIILRQARRSSGIVNELLDLARIEAGGVKDFRIELHDLRDIVTDVVSTISRSSTRISLRTVERPVVAMVDKEKIHQAVFNLVANAVKFSDDALPVVISFRNRLDDETEWIGIEIADRGIGMTPEQQARFGERFFRADLSGSIPGTGLGAALCKEIISHHGGKLEVRSVFGRGSRLTIWIPAVAPWGLLEGADISLHTPLNPVEQASRVFPL